MSRYTSSGEYLAELEHRARLPEGFRCAVHPIRFVPAERPVSTPLPMNLSLILLDEPTTAFAGLFTRNAMPGAPVLIGRRLLSEETVRGVLVNNKVSNVCAPGGEEDALELVRRLAELMGEPETRIFPSSTGIIGWKLPVREMKNALPELLAGLHGGSAADLARGIMTTDSFPKARSAEAGAGRILGVAKGAGMIEPNMATMLAFLMTDLDIPREELRAELAAAAEESFNRISVDGDQSTSDTLLLFSSRRRPAPPRGEFRRALRDVCSSLAEDIVRNGEGAGHVIRVSVRGARNPAEALLAAKGVVNSPLVKSAVFGNDPNVGRIVSSLGDNLGNRGILMDRERLTLSLGGRKVFRGGAFVLDGDTERVLSAYFADASFDPAIKGYPQHEKTVDIEIDLGVGAAEASALGTDLSYEYVRENADYRS